MDPQRVQLLVDRYRGLAWLLAVGAGVGWSVVAAMLDGPRSLDTAWAVWLAIAATSTVLSGTCAVLAAVWAATGLYEPGPEADQWT